MKDNEEILRKKQDELNTIKSKLGSYAKKEGNTYATRDFCDDVYEPKHAVNKDVFVSSSHSGMFTDCLVVIPHGKTAAFQADMLILMDDYYKKLDETEARRFKDQAKIRLGEIKESVKEEEVKEFIEKVVVFAKTMNHPQAN